MAQPQAFLSINTGAGDGEVAPGPVDEASLCAPQPPTSAAAISVQKQDLQPVPSCPQQPASSDERCIGIGREFQNYLESVTVEGCHLCLLPGPFFSPQYSCYHPLPSGLIPLSVVRPMVISLCICESEVEAGWCWKPRPGLCCSVPISNSRQEFQGCREGITAEQETSGDGGLWATLGSL